MKFNHPKLKEYKYLETIGKGGQGIVYKVQENSGRRFYALKILHERDDLTLFEKEVKALTSIRHKNVVPIYDFSFGEDNSESFILMEYMKHASIKKYLKNNKQVSLYERVLLIQDISYALQHIHDKGLIHRDIKPENIFVTDDGEGGAYACLGDFGIAKEIESETETEGGKGTRMYQPLEVLDGKEHSKKTDIYGLGISMYEILIGKHPSKNYVDYIDHLINDIAFDKPSKHNSQLNSDIDNICIKAIAPKEENRYQSVNEFVKDLKNYISSVHGGVECERNKLNNDIVKKEEEIENLDQVESEIVYKHRFDEAQLDLPDGCARLILIAGIMVLINDLLPKSDQTLIQELGDDLLSGKEYSKTNEEEFLKTFKVLMKKEKKNDVKALFYMGQIYERGYGKKKDYDKAIKLYKRLLRLLKKGEKYEGLFVRIGNMYYEGGWGIKKDKNEALVWYKRTEGIGPVLGRMGDIYQYGTNIVEADLRKALEYYQLALGISGSRGVGERTKGLIYNNLGNMYMMREALKGEAKLRITDDISYYWPKGKVPKFENPKISDIGITRNLQEALECYRKAVYNGYVGAIANIGTIYRYGREGIQKDEIRAITCYEDAVKKGNLKAALLLGDFYATGGDQVEKNYQLAQKNYEKVIEEGLDIMLINVGDLYRKGDIHLQQDYTKAMEYYRKAIEQGYDIGLVKIGDLYISGGPGVEKNINEALKYYEQALSKGVIDIEDIAFIYQEEEWHEIGYEKAIKWLKKRKGANMRYSSGGKDIAYNRIEKINVKYYSPYLTNYYKRMAQKGHRYAVLLHGYMHLEEYKASGADDHLKRAFEIFNNEAKMSGDTIAKIKLQDIQRLILAKEDLKK